MFPGVKSFFLSHFNSPIILEKFFEKELAEAYRWHLHFIMSMFYTNIQEIGRERNSVLWGLTALQLLQ
jgi:hypothetical protein